MQCEVVLLCQLQENASRLAESVELLKSVLGVKIQHEERQV